MTTSNIVLTLLVNAAVFTLLFGVMMLVRRVFHKKLSAMMQYILWAVVLIKLAIPFGFESTISPFNLFTAAVEPGIVQTAPISTMPQPMQSENGNIAYTSAEPTSVIQVPQINSEMNKGLDQTTAYTGSMLPPAPVSWTVWALMAWGAGTAGTGIWLGLGSWQLRRRIRHAKMAIPDEVMRVFTACRKELGIRRNVKILMQHAIPAPAVMGIFHPVLVLPADIDGADTEKIRHVCMHEMVHLKKGDLVAILILNILNVIYWFNPFTWLCFRIIRKDMETVCDHKVVTILGQGGRQGYISTVLQYAGRASSMLHAAMSINDGRQRMEKRIHAMYKRRRTSAGGKAAAVVIALVLMATGALTACQPTPDKPIIVQKNDGKLEEKIAQPPLTSYKMYEAPPHWKETYQREKLTVEFDTDITLPNADKYPVIKVEPVQFTQQRVDELVNYFAAGKKLYLYPDVKTKAEYAQEIIEAKRGQEVDGKYVVTEDSKDWVKKLEIKMKEAPETYAREYVSTTLTYERDSESGKPDTEAGKNFLSVAVDTGATDDPTIFASNYVQSKGKSTNFIYYKPHEAGMTESLYRQNIMNVQDNEQKKYEAIFASIPGSVKENYLAQAQNVMEDLQIKDLVLVKTDKVALQGVTTSRPQKGGYTFEFARANGGIPGYEPTTILWRNGEEPPEYSPPFNQESLSITVSDEGIQSFIWRGCVKAVETESDNVELLPFDQIKERVKNQLFYKNPFGQGTDSVESLSISVSSAELRMGYIQVKGRADQALLVPMWVFHTQGFHTIPVDPRNPEKGTKTAPANFEDYLFNAIDGGVIKMKRPSSNE